MPIYAYRCNKCSEKFEAFRGIYDCDEGIACPKCGEKKPQKVLSTVYSRAADPNRGNLRFPT
jgi:putative FmdB family regulatory protein